MPDRKPRDEEIDVYGVSDRGKLRSKNEDHFLLASVHRRVNIIDTNLSELDRLPLADQRLALVAMVADGVGGATGGERASAIALETATQYIVSSLDCYDRSAAVDGSMTPALQDAALKSHEAVLERASAEGDGIRMATTLTLWMGVWPWYYLLQVGDSRYYLYRDGRLTQVTTDQTIAQELLDLRIADDRWSAAALLRRRRNAGGRQGGRHQHRQAPRCWLPLPCLDRSLASGHVRLGF